VAYSYLKQHYRCEYVYKNEIAIQLLLKYHNDNSATLLKEVASDGSIADIIIINGETVAYEIKTERDSFERLSKQLNSYQYLYDKLYIVTYPEAIDALNKRISEDIGIISFGQSGLMEVMRESGSFEDRFNPDKAILTLRQSELVQAHKKYVGELPEMGTALIYEFCYKWFMSLDKTDSHIVFNEALKSRKPSPYQFDLVKNCNPSLKISFLGRELPKKYCTLLSDEFGILG
jgi:hypothetical protein